MKIYDWLDPRCDEHVRAYAQLKSTGMWPKGFLPKDVELTNLWQIDVMCKLADAYIEDVLKKSAKDAVCPIAKLTGSCEGCTGSYCEGSFSDA